MEFDTAKPLNCRKSAKFFLSGLCGFLRLCGVFLDMIKFEHTIFALPFAYIGALLAPLSIIHYPLSKFIWITIAMVAIRTTGMCINRVVDRHLDAINPRTKNWALPKGQFSVETTKLITGIALAVFILSCLRLNFLCFALSPIAVLLVFIYPYLKRFTIASHIFLGLVLACAPIGGWIATAGRFSLAPLALSCAVIFWVAGFDIIYSLQDIDFDKKNQLFSIPANFGVEKAILTARVFHILSAVFLIIFGILVKGGLFFWSGVGVFLLLLISEHCLIKPYNLARINTAFFVMNGYASIILLIFVGLDRWRTLSLA